MSTNKAGYCESDVGLYPCPYPGYIQPQSGKKVTIFWETTSVQGISVLFLI